MGKIKKIYFEFLKSMEKSEKKKTIESCRILQDWTLMVELFEVTLVAAVAAAAEKQSGKLRSVS